MSWFLSALRTRRRPPAPSNAASRFESAGLRGLEPLPKLERHQRLPAAMRQAILDLKREHPLLHFREISTICWACFGQRPSPTTVRRILAEQPPSPRIARRVPPYHGTVDPFTRRRTVLRLHFEGWNKASIAAYLETSRPTLDDILKRWAEEQFAGLHDKSRRPLRRQGKQSLQLLLTIKELQENPGLGEFRVFAALKQLGIELSPRTCGRILALNRKLYGLPKPTKAPHEPKAMPFAAQYRHQVWTTDLRYLDHALGDFNVYCVSIFLAERAQQIYAEVGIQKDEIARHQPWQSYIETMFNVQRRMADWNFARAATWAELELVHTQWVEDYNNQEHWAHQRREDGRKNPKAVLDWVQGRAVDAAALLHAFAPVQYPRRADHGGYVRFRRWRLYGERGLARKTLGVWLTGGQLTVVYSDEPLAQYAVTYERDRHHLKAVAEERLYETPFRSQQPLQWEPAEGEWLRVLRLKALPMRRRRRAGGTQGSRFMVAE